MRKFMVGSFLCSKAPLIFNSHWYCGFLARLLLSIVGWNFWMFGAFQGSNHNTFSNRSASDLWRTSPNLTERDCKLSVNLLDIFLTSTKVSPV